MKFLFINKTALLTLSFYFFLAGCKKENLAKRFVGNYKGVTALYDINSVTPTLLQTYSDSRVAITETDRNTVHVVLFVDSSLTFEQDCAINSNTNFSSESNAGVYNVGSSGNLNGDKLSFRYSETGVFSSVVAYEFEGTGY